MAVHEASAGVHNARRDVSRRLVRLRRRSRPLPELRRPGSRSRCLVPGNADGTPSQTSLLEAGRVHRPQEAVMFPTVPRCFVKPRKIRGSMASRA
jgi:hypothetical protein